MKAVEKENERRMVTVEVANAVRDVDYFADGWRAGAWARAKAPDHSGDRRNEGAMESRPSSVKPLQVAQARAETAPDDPFAKAGIIVWM